MNAAEWVEAFCRRIGAPVPDQGQMDEILRLAAVAAHASERTAAPISCWVAGGAGRPLAELIDEAESLAREAEQGG